ncbi:MAG: hypothetical protein JRD89_20955 [Deltaproteobacteria bacterium]|nr:hypothetical protein [Deltaproteobacteria bacterium]
MSSIHTQLHDDIIAKEFIMQFKNNTRFVTNVHQGHSKEFRKVGETIRVQKPNRFMTGSGSDITSSMNALKESSVNLTLSQEHCAIEFTAKDLTLGLDRFSERIIQPVVDELANKVDADGLAQYYKVYNAAGTAGTTPGTFAAIGDAATKLDNYGVPRKDRKLVLNPAAEWSIANALKGLYLEKEVRGMVTNGLLGRTGSFDIYGDQNVVSHTAGGNGGDPVVCLDSDISAGTTGLTYLTSDVNGSTSTVYLDGATASTEIFTQGDIITLGVYGVNPKNRNSTGQLQQFTVISGGTADSSGYLSLVVSPAIVTAAVNEAYQTVVSAPAENAVPVLVGSHVANLAFHKNAFTFATAQLEVLDGCKGSTATDDVTGISMRYMRQGNIYTDVNVMRFDILYAWQCINPGFACRLLG